MRGHDPRRADRRLGETLKRYFASLFSGEHDARRNAAIVKIGVVHDRIDVAIVTQTFIDSRDRTVEQLERQTLRVSDQQGEIANVSQSLAAAARSSRTPPPRS